MESTIHARGRRLLRRLAGWLWAVAWLLVLRAFVAPWDDLGGVVSERLRWLEQLVAGGSIAIGCTLGRVARDLAPPGSGRSHATLIRGWLLVAGGTTAVALVLLEWSGRTDWIGVVATGFLGCWAGFDIGFAAYPLMSDEPYSFGGPIERAPFGDAAGDS